MTGLVITSIRDSCCYLQIILLFTFLIRPKFVSSWQNDPRCQYFLKNKATSLTFMLNEFGENIPPQNFRAKKVNCVLFIL